MTKDVVCVITRIYLTRRYYRMGGGGCRRLLCDKRGNVDEYPHIRDNAAECKLPGRHPHANAPVRGRRRKSRSRT